MLNINFIIENLELVQKSMKSRNSNVNLDEIVTLHTKTKEIMQKTQELQSQKNNIAKKIGAIKSGKSNENLDDVLKEADTIKEKLGVLEDEDRNNQTELNEKLSHLPNILQECVPFGLSEDENVQVKTYGEKKVKDFETRQHHEIGEDLGLMDFESARKISGSRFTILHKDLAKLERALANFMLDSHINDFGYNEINVPQLVCEKSMYGTGQLPKFDNGYITTDGMYLIPTSEVPITNIVADKILSEEELPFRYCGYSQCFRSESGSAGKDLSGMFRNHQFSKVELVSIVKPEDSNNEHERMLSAAENILKKLELHYEVRLLCSGDTGFSSSKTYDINVWLDGQKRYREISSCSNMRDFQARRMMARYKDGGSKNQYLHTLNGSGLAVGRTIIAIIENYQNSDGSFDIPAVLIPYMNGLTKISKSGC